MSNMSNSNFQNYKAEAEKIASVVSENNRGSNQRFLLKDTTDCHYIQKLTQNMLPPGFKAICSYDSHYSSASQDATYIEVYPSTVFNNFKASMGWFNTHGEN